jgi:hypothetical protein
MEDTVWPFEGRLEEYVRRSGTHYAAEMARAGEAGRSLLRVEAGFRPAFGSHRRREIVLWQKVVQPAFLTALLTREVPPEYKLPGTWMHDALELRDRWQSKLLRRALVPHRDRSRSGPGRPADTSQTTCAWARLGPLSGAVAASGGQRRRRDQVEPPGGDCWLASAFRMWGREQSLVADLAAARGRDRVALAAEADVVISKLAGGVDARFGLDP